MHQALCTTTGLTSSVNNNNQSVNQLRPRPYKTDREVIGSIQTDVRFILRRLAYTALLSFSAV